LKALVKTAKGPGFIEIQDLGVPKISSPDWVLIRVKAAGICGTDLHIWHDQFPYWPPVVLGHEFAGEIVEVGAKVTKWKVGDRVVAEPHSLACGECELCRKGQIQLCASKRSPGWGINGGFAEYVTMPAFLLHAVPPEVPDTVAAIAEPMAIAIHQVLERGRVEFRDTVVVSGAGPIGILAAFLAKKAGAATVIATGIGRSEEVRFPVCRKLGADYCLNAENVDIEKTVRELTGGRGADFVVEASGSPAAIAQAFALVRTGGRISAIGITGRAGVTVPWDVAIQKVVDISFNMSSSSTSWPRSLSTLGSFHTALSDYVTAVVGLDEWERAFTRLEAEKDVKTVFRL
jgi:L-iditol 2-dehydrogenase